MISRTRPRGNANKIAIVALVILGLFVAFVCIMLFGSKTTSARVFFDNGSDAHVKVDLDGKTSISVDAHNAALETVDVGKHHLRVIADNGKTVEEADIEVPEAQGIVDRKWAFNVGKKSRYMVRYVAYGNAEPDKPKPIGDGAQFFELPSADAAFLPYEGVSQKGKAGTTKATVGHIPVHPETWPCCKNLRALMEDEKPAK